MGLCNITFFTRTVLLVHCSVGWVDFGHFKFSTKVPVGFVTYISKVTNSTEYFFYPVTASSFVMTYWVMHYCIHGAKHFFFTKWTSWVSKDAEFYVDFKNINLL
jgi:hypothetical protein